LKQRKAIRRRIQPIERDFHQIRDLIRNAKSHGLKTLNEISEEINDETDNQRRLHLISLSVCYTTICTHASDDLLEQSLNNLIASYLIADDLVQLLQVAKLKLIVEYLKHQVDNTNFYQLINRFERVKDKVNSQRRRGILLPRLKPLFRERPTYKDKGTTVYDAPDKIVNEQRMPKKRGGETSVFREQTNYVFNVLPQYTVNSRGEIVPENAYDLGREKDEIVYLQELRRYYRQVLWGVENKEFERRVEALERDHLQSPVP
jgi:hypothetical protein